MLDLKRDSSFVCVQCADPGKPSLSLSNAAKYTLTTDTAQLKETPHLSVCRSGETLIQSIENSMNSAKWR